MFTYLDIIVVLLIAISVLLGIIRGFVKSITKLIGSIARLVIAFFLCQPFAKLLQNIFRFDDKIMTKIDLWAEGLSPNFTINLVGMNEYQLDAAITGGLSDSSIPKIFRGMFKNFINLSPENINSYQNITISDLIASSLTNVIMVAIAFVVLYFIVWLVVFLLNKVVDTAIKDKPILKNTNRILGAVVGLVKSFVVIFIVCGLLYLFRNSFLFSGLFTTLSKSVIAGPISNFIFVFIENNINFSDMIQRYLNK